jgi:hypothetical protein
MPDFHGLPTAALANEHVRLEYLTNAGPRIVGLSAHGSPNLLADVHDMIINAPHGEFRFLGGHRLWISPESLETSYIGDHFGLEVNKLPNGVELIGQSEPYTGVRKSLKIELLANLSAFRLTHTIQNEAEVSIRLAPWAITMFRQGGTAILPQPTDPVDKHSLLPNRFLELWPYTRINDDRLVLRDDYILVRARPELPPLKVGYLNTAGWLAYWLDGVLFRKSFDALPKETYPDGGCNAEVYCGDRFIELESLAPLAWISPGETVVHRETWEMNVPFLPPDIIDLL